MAEASAWVGEQGGMILAQIFSTSPLWSLATTAIALLFLAVAASVLSFTHPCCGGCHLPAADLVVLCHYSLLTRRGWSWAIPAEILLKVFTAWNSAMLLWMCLMASWMSTIPPLCTAWFLVLQISSRISAILSVIIHIYLTGHGEEGGSMMNLMTSSEVDIEWSFGLKPHPQENHRALATVQFKNRCVGDSASNWHSAL